MNDEAIPPFWSDERLYPYLNDAQMMFARETGGLPDSSSDMTKIDYALGDTSFVQDERVLKIRAARDETTGEGIEVINYEDIPKYGFRLDGRTGPYVKYLIIGMDENVLMYPTPTAAGSIRLTVDRLPLADITLDDPENGLEIKPHHHLHLLHWMKSLAYMNQDAEIFNKSKAQEFEQRFLAYCEKARKEKDRLKHKTRVVTYGGLPMVNRVDDDYRRR